MGYAIVDYTLTDDNIVAFLIIPIIYTWTMLLHLTHSYTVVNEVIQIAEKLSCKRSLQNHDLIRKVPSSLQPWSHCSNGNSSTGQAAASQNEK